MLDFVSVESVKLRHVKVKTLKRICYEALYNIVSHDSEQKTDAITRKEWEHCYNYVLRMCLNTIFQIYRWKNIALHF